MNPPYSASIQTNIGKEFLNIIREEFPRGHSLYPVINKNTIKVSYRCMPNMAKKISSHNNKILNDNTNDTPAPNDTEAGTIHVTFASDDAVVDIVDQVDINDEDSSDEEDIADDSIHASNDVNGNGINSNTNARTCNCRGRRKLTCPLRGNCLVCCLVYKATVTRLDNCHCETYTGVTAGTFKCRWYGHCHDMSHRPDEENKGTTLSNYVWQLKDQGINHDIKWSVVTRGADYNPATGICRVCLLEKFFIMFRQDGASLNQRSEFFTHCRHFSKFLLCSPPPKKGRKRKPNR